MKNIDSKRHVTGKSVYVDDIPELSNTLHAQVVYSSKAHAEIISVSIEDDPRLLGFITAGDIPGENQVGGIIPDEELLADKITDYQGQPIAIVIAKTKLEAQLLRDKVHVEYNELRIITDPREAYEQNQLIMPPRTIGMGNIDAAWDDCSLIIDGKVELGGQEHLYLETQGVYAIPNESGMKIISSTQGPTQVQKAASRVLSLPMHTIEVDVRRLGGAFGGKEDQATPVACIAALAAHIMKHPVKYILDRHDDLKSTGKRHPYSADYKIGMKNNKIHAYEVTFYQNAGAAADLSPAVLGRTLFHATNSYFIPNVKITGISAKTNLPPNTAFRGFGGPQGMFVIEAALHKVADVMGISREELQFHNLLVDGDEFPYGQQVEFVSLSSAWKQLIENTTELRNAITSFNKQSKMIKKGWAIMPVSFGISFNNLVMNQASALVNIYSDGSVGVSTGAIEMGQGVNTRIVQVVMNTFGITEDKIKMETTNTIRAINTSPSAASSTHDLNGWATENACTLLRNRLLDAIEEKSKFMEIKFENNNILSSAGEVLMSWEELVQLALSQRIDLAAHGYYATPKIHYDNSIEKGHPFAYHAFGVALVSATVDCLRGIYKLDHVEIVHDSGKMLNSDLDLGQIEGALVQGLGWMLLEELRYDEKGRLLSNSLSTYKVPDIHFVPTIHTNFIGQDNPLGLMGSKAVGEPPLMYGIAGYFAIRNAMNSFKPLKMPYDTPLTPEKILLGLWNTSAN
ncbi:MAG: molybdopterin-dependent oxidoreductase [Candidatus Heimdallarchaeota archaeon]|nr:molybdopterin-dependent oxidoreductase [Candidatus Heimdallarchaeota archaeon]